MTGATFLTLASVNEEQIQNVQELASIWGDIRRDIERLGGDLDGTYCLVGRYDFLLLFDAADRDVALQISIAIERYGLDTETMPATPVERFGELVGEI